MTEWIDWFRQYAFEGGLGGLFVLSIIDSAGVPTGGGPDIVIALLASLHPNAPYAVGLVIAAIVGSVIGCSMLYWAGLRGGEASARQFAFDAVARTRRSLERHGAWMVFLAMLAPPPIPTKIFVLCAGVADLPILRFLIATIVGRVVCYGAGAVLAVHYGPRALDMLRAGTTTFLLFLVPPCLFLLAYLAVRRWLRRSATRP